MAKKNKVVELENYRDQFVTVYATEANKYHKKGVAHELHPDAAQHLINKGLMTEEQPEGFEEDDENSSED